LSRDAATKPKIVDVMAWRSDIGQPGAESLVDALLQAVTTTPAGDETALRGAFTRTILEGPSVVATSRRIPDRDLVQSLAPERAAQRAADVDFESGKFQVVPPDPTWSVALDLQPADIFLS
jgi:hypothetical protein